MAAELHTTTEDVAEAEAEAPAAAHGVEEIAGDRSWLAHRLRDPRTLLSFALAVALFLFIFRGLNLDLVAVGKTIQGANLGYFLLGFGFYYAAFILRGLRWRTLLANVGYSQEQHPNLPNVGGLIEIIYLSWFVNCIVPAKLGDVYRGYLLKERGGVSFARTIGTLLAERMIDLFILFGLLVVAGFLTVRDKLSGTILEVMGLGGALVVVLLIGLIVLRVFGDRVLVLLPHRFREIFTGLQHGTLQSFRRSSLPLLIGFTAAIWLMEGLRLFWVVQSLGQGNLISLPVVIFIALASSLLTTLPLTPGGIGLVEGATIVVLGFFGVSNTIAGSISILDRLINYWSIVVGGLIVYLITRRRRT